MTKKAMVIDTKDNVANLIGAGERGEVVTVEAGGQTTEYTLADNIPPNHKFAIAAVKQGEAIVKYGYRIGRATCDIAVGQHVHAHNIESLRGRGDLQDK